MLLTYRVFAQPVPLLDQTISSNKRKKERKKDYGPGIKFTSRSLELFDARYTTKAKERFNESFQEARMEMCASEEHREISFHFGCRVFVLWQNTNRNRMGFHIETEPFPRWLRLCLIASINKGYSLRISRVEFSQAFQPEVFPARDRVWVLKQAERERERDTHKRREIEASIEPNTPQLEMLEWVASDPGRLSHSVHVKLVASAKRKQNNCSLRVTYDNTRLPIFSLLSVLRPSLTGVPGKFCSPTIASPDSPRNRFPNKLDDILSFFCR